MQPNINLKTWVSLALDQCPDCGHSGLLVESQQDLAAILTCPECGVKYWMSPLREKGARKISHGVDS